MKCMDESAAVSMTPPLSLQPKQESLSTQQQCPKPKPRLKTVAAALRKHLPDEGSFGPRREPNPWPFDPHEVWANIKKEALNKGDMKMANLIVAPVLYPGRG